MNTLKVLCVDFSAELPPLASVNEEERAVPVAVFVVRVRVLFEWALSDEDQDFKDLG